MTTVLVTGANSGIGADDRAALLERGADVVATVRTPDAVAAVHDGTPVRHSPSSSSTSPTRTSRGP